MKYLTQIEAYVSRQMMGAEREAFEHEVADNMELAKELEAYQVSADLFDFTAENLSEEQILGVGEHGTISKTGPKFSFSYTSLSILIFAAILLILFAIWKGNQPTTTPTQPVEEKERLKNMPVAQSPSTEASTSGREQLSAMLETVPSASNINSPTLSTPRKKPLTRPETKPVNVQVNLEAGALKATKEDRPSKEVISNALITNGEEIVYHAAEQITLTPGFHAKAGSSFKAMVKRD